MSKSKRLEKIFLELEDLWTEIEGEENEVAMFDAIRNVSFLMERVE